MMADEKSEVVIVPKKRGNALGGKDYRIMILQRKETQVDSEPWKTCQQNFRG